MARKYLVPIDLTKQELQNARIQNLASAPASPAVGQIYYDTTVNSIYFWNGTAWVNSASSVAYGTLANRPAASASNNNTLYYATDNALLYVSNGTTWSQVSSFGSGASTTVSITGSAADGSSTSYARADHTHAGPGFGTVVAQTTYNASTTSGSATTVARSDHSHGTPPHTDTEHSGIHLNALAAPTGDVSLNSHKLTSVTDPTSAQDAATKNYVDTRSLSNFSAPTGNLSIGSNKLTNVTDPTSAQDAATKAYVDGRKVTDLTAPTSAFSMNSQKITNLATPTADTDAANKGYVDNAIAGLDWKPAVHLMSASNVGTAGSSGTLNIDGHPLGTSEDGYRLLLTGQTTASENGIYVYSDSGGSYTLVRATDADNYTELVGAAVFVQEGATYGSTAWIQSNHYISSFSNQVWTQFSGQGTYSATNGVQLNGNVFSFNPTIDGGLGASSNGAFVKLQNASGLSTNSNGLTINTSNGLTVNGGYLALYLNPSLTSGLTFSSGGLTVNPGTGITTAANTVAIDTSVVARKYSAAIGNGALTSITVTHNLGTRDVQVTVRETNSPYAQVECDVEMATTNTVTLGFAVAPTSNQYTVTVIG